MTSRRSFIALCVLACPLVGVVVALVLTSVFLHEVVDSIALYLGLTLGCVLALGLGMRRTGSEIAQALVITAVCAITVPLVIALIVLRGDLN